MTDCFASVVPGVSLVQNSELSEISVKGRLKRRGEIFLKTRKYISLHEY